MSVEGGSCAGAVGVGAAVSMGPSIGVSIPSMEMGSPFSTIVNEGLRPIAFLENTMPLTVNRFNPIGEIVFKPSEPLVIRQAESIAAVAWEKSRPLVPAEVVSQAEAIIAQAQQKPLLEQPAVTINPSVIPNVEPVVLPWVDYQPAPVPVHSPILEPVTNTGSKSESRVSYKTAAFVSNALSPQPLPQEQGIEETVEEKVRVEDKKGSQEEEDMVEKRLYLEDEQALGQRRYEVREAINKAKAEADKLGLKKIAGFLVAKFLPAEHPGNRSQVLKNKGPDGSYLETVEAIASSGEFDCEVVAQERFNEIVAEKKPVKDGKQGNPVKNEDVSRVFKYRTVKPPAAYEITVNRVKKKAPVPSGQIVQAQTETRAETSLEDYPELAEVFRG